MRAKKLSGRLKAMADFVGIGETVADIGADHGYLPLFLIYEGISPSAILTDNRSGPLEKTRLSVSKAGAGKQDARVALRLGDGLSAIAEGEVDTVVIAGMGGETIISILANDLKKTQSFRKYILQPRTKTDMLLSWLSCLDFEIIASVSAEEKGRFCDIIVCAPKGVQKIL